MGGIFGVVSSENCVQTLLTELITIRILERKMEVWQY